jgi:hypothetical protein
VLGGVVGGVLAEVAVGASLGDGGDDRRSPDLAEIVQLRFESFQSFPGNRDALGFHVALFSERSADRDAAGASRCGL